jgi:prepilin-type N-terminal cleavage/methylation domain-containing protein
MRTIPGKKKQRGFSLLEMLAAVGVFLVISGAVFALLNITQQRQQTEAQVLDSFQEARLGLDQIVRDVNDAGYPPPNHFSTLPAANLYASSPFAWSPNYPATSCAIGVCTRPDRFDLIVETDIDPQKNNGVEWIRYKLQGTTLLRGVVSKVAGADPVTTTAPSLVPYVQNVMNNASAAEIAQFQGSYPAMFPGGDPVPIFRFMCDTSAGPKLCSTAGPDNSAQNVRDVQITLIVKAPSPDLQTGQTRMVELRGLGHRINPNN